MRSAKARMLLCCLAAPLAAAGGYFFSEALFDAYLQSDGPLNLLTLYLINALEQALCFALPAALVLSARPGRWRRALAGERAMDFRAVSLILLLAVSATVTVSLIAVFWQALTGIPGQAAAMPTPEGPGEWLLALLAVAVTPALCEELFFRCALQKALCRRLPRAGVWIVALAFALLHRQWDALPGLLLLGLVLGGVYRRYGLRGSALLHLLYNALVLVLVQLETGVTLTLAAAFALAFVLSLRGLLKKEEPQDEADDPGL